MHTWSDEHAQDAAFAAIEAYLAGRLDSALSASCAVRLSGGAGDLSGKPLEEVRSQDLAAWQERGYLSHLNAAALISEYYERQISHAARALRQERNKTGQRKARLRAEYHRLRHERTAVHAWLVGHGWDPDLERAAQGGDWEVAGHCWTAETT